MNVYSFVRLTRGYAGNHRHEDGKLYATHDGAKAAAMVQRDKDLEYRLSEYNDPHSVRHSWDEASMTLKVGDTYQVKYRIVPHTVIE